MLAFRFRPTATLAGLAMLSGCNSIVIEHAKLDADLPLAPAAVMSDRSSFGDIAIQGAIRVSDGSAWTDSVYQWTNGRAGGYVQAQMALNRYIRVVGGGGLASTPSYWIGAASTNKLGSLDVDTDLLLGYTRQTHFLMGYENSYRHENPGLPTPDSLLLIDHGTLWSSWMNLAVRVRTIGSGPWAEIRYLPRFDWGSLQANSGTYGRTVSTSAYAYSIGWHQFFEDGSILMVGPRATRIAYQSMPDFQLMASYQVPLKF